MYKEILVNADTEETRVAVLEDGILVEFYLERPVSQRLAGNIYKGKVENVLPGMQAAFVNIGLEKNAFLYVADAVASRGNGEDMEIFEDIKEVSIKDVLRQGQNIIVQITKEPMGSKGARVTTHVTLPGRYLVLMPTVDYVGVSRRIENDKERERLKGLAQKLKPRHSGVIVRTVAEGKDEEEIKYDIEFLNKLWTKTRNKAKKATAPAIIHKDLGLIERIIRDILSTEVDKLIIDSRHEYEKVLDYLDIISPDLKSKVHLFNYREGAIFDVYGIEAEIDKSLKRKVWLKCGGYIVIDHTEALTVIDVNTGKFVGSENLADTVLKTNLEATREIARQIRLRNTGGIIVIDFIDMEVHEHREQVLKALEEALKKDRTKANVLGITQLGLVEMTRKKTSQGLEDVLQKTCPYCEGKGLVLSEETMSRKVEREIKKILKHSVIEAILVEVHPSVAALIIGSGGSHLRELERATGKHIYIRGSTEAKIEEIKICVAGTKEEVEVKALPVKPGQVLEVKIEEPHVSNPANGIARLEGYVLDIEGAGEMVGEKIRTEITKVFRTYAKGKITAAGR
jgi:ribonuclease G